MGSFVKEVDLKKATADLLREASGLPIAQPSARKARRSR
jgi:hypothetical protein